MTPREWPLRVRWVDQVEHPKRAGLVWSYTLEGSTFAGAHPHRADFASINKSLQTPQLERVDPVDPVERPKRTKRNWRVTLEGDAFTDAHPRIVDFKSINRRLKTPRFARHEGPRAFAWPGDGTNAAAPGAAVALSHRAVFASTGKRLLIPRFERRGYTEDLARLKEVVATAEGGPWSTAAFTTTKAS